MIGLRLHTGRKATDGTDLMRAFGLVLMCLQLTACGTDWLPHVDLSPPYQPPQYVVPCLMAWRDTVCGGRSIGR